jgi:long-chain acyl-CoA synthetase
LTAPRHLAELLEQRAVEGRDAVALRSKKSGRWVSESWQDWSSASRALAASLVAAGVAKAERVLLFSSTREEWVLLDFAILGAGAVTVPVYPNSTAEQVAEILESSGARRAFVEGKEALEALRGALAGGAAFDEIVVLDSAVADGPVCRASLPDVPVRAYAELLRDAVDAAESRQEALTVRQQELGPDDVATIVYTSGTTGSPRGAVLTHGSLLHEAHTLTDAVPIGPEDEQLMFLPLAHIFARVVLYAAVRAGMRTAFAEGMHRVVDNFAEVRPTVFASVPRLFEKVFAVANESASAEGAVKERLWRWAVGIGLSASRARQRGERPSGLLAARLRYADKIALGKVRQRFGGRLRFAVSGGAPLSKELAEWFHAMGILVLEGYGLTEMCGCTHVNRLDRFRFGSVGLPIEGVEVALGKDGEVLMRGPTLMQGFFGQPEATRAVVDERGWLHTGDVGRLDPDGFLEIVDRKKDLIVTAGGSNVAPANLERMLMSSPWISRAVVLGDRERYIVALFTLDLANVKRWAIENRRGTDPAALARDPELRALIQLDVDDVNRRLSRFEQVRKFSILEHDLSVAAGELTETDKPRRETIRERHAPLIRAMYDASAPFHSRPDN